MKSFHRTLPSTLGAQSKDKDVHVLANAVRIIEDYLLDVQQSMKSLSENKTPDAKKEIIVDVGTGSGVTDHGLLAGLIDDDHTQYVALDGRVNGQQIKSMDATKPTIQVRRASSGTPNIIDFTNSAGSTILSNINNDGSFIAAPGSNTTTPIVDIHQGATVGTYAGNTAIRMDLGAAQATGVGGAAVEIQRGANADAAAINWDGSFTSFAAGSSGIRWWATDAGATKFSFRGVSDKEAEFNIGSITNSTKRTYTLPDKDGTVAMTSDIGAGSGISLAAAMGAGAY